jgi:hypothetical protein
MRARELSSDTSLGTISKDFASFVQQELEIDQLPSIELENNLDLSDEFQTFGLFQQSGPSIRIQTQGRHLLDILRTLAHELVHHRQLEIGDLDNGTDIQDLEDSANAVAGRLLRTYYKQNPELFSATADRLTEQADPNQDLDNAFARDIPWDKIKAECSDILELYSDARTFLYHGNKHVNQDWYIARPRENRAPVDTPQIMQNYIDHYFQAAGLTALRSNSIFTSARMGHAKEYGVVYLIFPRNGFAWTGSRWIRDLYSDDPLGAVYAGRIPAAAPSAWNTTSLEDDLRAAFYAPDSKIPDEVKSAIAFSWNRFKQNPAAIRTVNNATIHLSYMFEKHAADTPEVQKLHQRYNQDTLTTPEKFVQGLGYNQTSLLDMLKTDNEILIRGEYYAVHSRHEQVAELALLTR